MTLKCLDGIGLYWELWCFCILWYRKILCVSRLVAAFRRMSVSGMAWGTSHINPWNGHEMGVPWVDFMSFRIKYRRKTKLFDTDC